MHALAFNDKDIRHTSCPGLHHFVFLGSFVVLIVNVFKDGSDAAFSARLLDAASGGLAHGGLCPFMVGATLLWLAPAGFQLSLLREFCASGLWICLSCKDVQATALLVAVSEQSVPVVLESSFEEDATALLVRVRD